MQTEIKEFRIDDMVSVSEPTQKFEEHTHAFSGKVVAVCIFLHAYVIEDSEGNEYTVDYRNMELEGDL
jgi:hypothetical protein